MSAMVTLTHPKLPDAVYACFPQQVEMWESLGWEQQQKTAKKAPAKQGADPNASDRAEKPAATSKEN